MTILNRFIIIHSIFLICRIMDIKFMQRFLTFLSCGVIFAIVFALVFVPHRGIVRSGFTFLQSTEYLQSIQNSTTTEDLQSSQKSTPTEDLQSSQKSTPTDDLQSEYSTPIPMHKMQYDLHPPFSKDLIVHTAFFDQRPRDSHTNVTIIFLTVNRTIMDSGWVIGCGVDGKNASAFSLYFPFENELLHDWLGEKPFKYENMQLHCYNMTGKNGSEVFVVYKTAQNSSEIKVVSRYPLYIPAPRVTPSREYNFTVVTCTKIHNRGASFIHEFVQYQKTLGVDHVHVSILDQFIKDNGFQDLILNDPLISKLYKEGYLTFSVWKDWYAKSSVTGGELSLHSEILRKLGCIFRFMGTYDFAMPLDTDDFFVPRIPGKTNLKDYILQYCYTKPAGSCRFAWKWHLPECGIEGKIIDGNVTKHLKTKIVYTSVYNNFKSVHRTKAFLDSSFHDARCPRCLKSGYHMVHVSTSIAYVAHNRYGLGKSRCLNKGPLV